MIDPHQQSLAHQQGLLEQTGARFVECVDGIMDWFVHEVAGKCIGGAVNATASGLGAMASGAARMTGQMASGVMSAAPSMASGRSIEGPAMAKAIEAPAIDIAHQCSMGADVGLDELGSFSPSCPNMSGGCGIMLG